MHFPAALRSIPSPPAQLFCRGAALHELLKKPRVAIVGSRGPTAYGKDITMRLARELARRGIVIVSGLALGVDALAHHAALEAGGLAVAVLPGPVNRVYPTTNRSLAESIVMNGGTLVSEYAPGSVSFKQNFIARNRLVAGLSQAILITEATEKSGSLHTARFAIEQGKDVLAAPGTITSKTSVGTNNLIRSGATPITSYKDILEALHIEDELVSPRLAKGRNAQEATILNLLRNGINSGDKLLRQSGLAVSDFNRALTMLEISGSIRPLGGNQWSLRER